MKQYLYLLILISALSVKAQTSGGFTSTIITSSPISDLCTDKAILPALQDYIRYNIPYNYNDTSVFDKFSYVYPNVRQCYFYNATFSKIPDVLINNTIHNIYFYSSAISLLPNAKIGSQIRQIILNQSLALPTSLPNNWFLMKYVNTIYLQLNTFNNAQINSLINQIESLANSGMGPLTTGIHYVYLNGLGVGQNSPPTLVTFTAAGWTQTGTAQNSYLQKNHTRQYLANLL